MAILKNYTKFVVKKIFKNADAVIAVSNFLLKSLKEHELIRSLSFVIPNVIDIQENFIQPQQKTNQKIKILTISLLNDRHKNISGLIRAFFKIVDKYPNIELHIVGDGEDKEKLEYIANELKLLNKNIFFHGFVPNNELYKYFSEANFFVLNSNFETFSVATAEALAHGVPVVVTRCGGPEEFINEQTGIIVERNSEESLLKGLEYMINNWQKYEPQKLIEYAKSKFPSEVVGKQFYGIYKSILKIYEVGLCGKKVKIEPSWKVLDVGSGHNPFKRANILLDKELDESIHRSGEKAKKYEHQLLVLGDATQMPFQNEEFDYSIASHIAEHIEDIDKFIEELQRVSKRGYIETPGPISEIMLNEPYHLWIVYKKGDTLIFKKKRKFRPLSKLFYALFYLNEKRYGHFTIYSNNFFLKLFKLLLNKSWKYIPFAYTRYEWSGKIKYKVFK